MNRLRETKAAKGLAAHVFKALKAKGLLRLDREDYSDRDAVEYPER